MCHLYKDKFFKLKANFGLLNSFYQKFPKLKAEASPGPSASTLHKTSFDNPLPEQSSKF